MAPKASSHGTPVRLIKYLGEGHDLVLPRSLRVRDTQGLLWMQRFVSDIRDPRILQ